MKRILIILVILLSLTLTGCIQKYTVSDEKSDAYAEYMAGLLLKEDKDYDKALLTEEEIKDEETTAEEDAVSEDQTDTQAGTDVTGDNLMDNTSNNTSGTGTMQSFSELTGIEGLQLNYNGYELVDSYPGKAGEAGFTLTPRDGYRLFVAEFTIKNTTNESIRLNMVDSKITYQLDMNNGTVYSPILTLLQNDLQYIDITISGNKSEQVLLVFEIARDSEMSDVRLVVTKDDKSSVSNIN